MPILITENGFSSIGYKLNDLERVKFLHEHLEQVFDTIIFLKNTYKLNLDLVKQEPVQFLYSIRKKNKEMSI